MSFLGPFEHTTGKTWGGAQISPGALQATSLLGDFFGLDHLLLRSPKTALMKLIVNVLTLGLWYWYDVIQAFQDIDFVKQYGYTFPIKGPVGLGVGIVGETSGPLAAPKGTPGPWMFLFYMMSLLVPFGASNLVAGDYQGAAAKLILTFFFLTTVFGILWWIYSMFFAVFDTKSLVTRGVDRPFPISSFMAPYGPSPNLMTPGVTQAEKELEGDSIFTQISEFFTGIYNKVFGIVEKPILEAVVSATEPIVNTAEEIKNTAESEMPNAAQQTGGAMNAVTNTAILLAAQQGGASDTASKALFLGAASLIFIGSILITYFRYWRAKKNQPTQSSEKNDIPPEGFQNDVPPGPTVL